jgi:hypothetical protein
MSKFPNQLVNADAANAVKEHPNTDISHLKISEHLPPQPIVLFLYNAVFLLFTNNITTLPSLANSIGAFHVFNQTSNRSHSQPTVSEYYDCIRIFTFLANSIKVSMNMQEKDAPTMGKTLQL